jgi:DNA-binding beta-propeller fold protein YncE
MPHIKKITLGVVLCGLVLAILLITRNAPPLQAQDNPTMTPMYAGKVNAPDFPKNLDWLNVSRPITIAELRGKVVLLDFWTYGCINCIHVIPDLKRLEAEFGPSLVVIGIHSAKFSNEGQLDNLRYIIKRYGIEHPVLNDNKFEVWQHYGVRAWPTLMLVDPEGKVVGYHAGEGVYDVLQPVIQTMIRSFSARNLIDQSPLPLEPLSPAASSSGLAFPTKVLADAAGSRLFIADTNNNRIIVANLKTFAVEAVIGGGGAGFADGDFATATFQGPHGLAISGDLLYIADTENHAIRAADLKSGTVFTLAGVGNQSTAYPPPGGPANSTALSSPWDLVYWQDALYIAMAGPHQIWKLDLTNGQVMPFIGNAREGLEDGPLADALLAQPSGIATDGVNLYFVDAESSAVRMAGLNQDGKVTTLVGTGLFDFGDADGVGEAVLLQHPQGVAIDSAGILYVADTYNDKIKRIDPTSRESTTFVGGVAGLKDGFGADAQLWEPGGLSYAEGKLYIADTNNNVIRIVDIATKTVSTLAFPNPEALQTTPPPAGETAAQPDMNDVPGEFFGDVIDLPAMEVGAGEGTLMLNMILPEGYKMNDLAPFSAHLYNNNTVLNIAPADNDPAIVLPTMPVSLPVVLREGSSAVTIDVAVFFCEAINESLCFPANLRFQLPLTVKAEGLPQVEIAYTLVPPITGVVTPSQ